MAMMLDGLDKKNLNDSYSCAARNGANMYEIGFPDTWCEGTGAYVVAPNSEEYIKVQQNYGSFDFYRPRIGQVCEIANKGI